jgi:hypothetical protein
MSNKKQKNKKENHKFISMLEELKESDLLNIKEINPIIVPIFKRIKKEKLMKIWKHLK